MTDTVARDLPPTPPPPGSRATRRDIRQTPLPAIAMVLALLALGVVVSWGLVVVILAIVGMIFLHELGHFVAAKKGGMKVTEFFIGFGPRLWSFRRGETEYGLKLLPGPAGLVPQAHGRRARRFDDARPARARRAHRRLRRLGHRAA